MRILIADDEALTRMGLRAILRDMGHSVLAAADGQTALQLARETVPDLAILDIKMPGLDGLAVAEALTEQSAVPVILLTAYSERDLVERAASTGAIHGYLVKPIREAELAPAIELAVARFREHKDLGDRAASHQEALDTRKAVARAKNVLMESQGLTERQAFLEIQHRARRQRVSMRQVADQILQNSTTEQ